MPVTQGGGRCGLRWILTGGCHGTFARAGPVNLLRRALRFPQFALKREEGFADARSHGVRDAKPGRNGGCEGADGAGCGLVVKL